MISSSSCSKLNASSSSSSSSSSSTSSYEVLSTTSTSPSNQQTPQFCSSNQNDSSCDYDLNTSFTSTSDYTTSSNVMCSKTNLIVNYLPHNMTQDDVKSLFARCGQLDTCKLVIDKLSGQSLGYAFVNYVRDEDAKRAVDTMNGMKIDNKIVKVSYARPSSDGIKGANVYVCGLKVETTQAELEKLFQPFGTIISSKILTDSKTGEAKGVGFVRFDQRCEAERAISKLNGKMLDGHSEPIIVKFANIPGKVHNGLVGLPLAPYIPVTRGVFQPIRSTTHSAYRYSPMSSYCTEAASFIHSTPTPTLMTSIPTLTGLPLTASIPLTSNVTQPLHALTAQTINPTSCMHKVSSNGWCIFVYNLGPEVDEVTLLQLFGMYGAIQSIQVIRDSLTFKCKGFAFVTMINYDQAVSAITSLNGAQLNGRLIQVSFKTQNNSKSII